MFIQLKGTKSNGVYNIVERGVVKKFAEAVGDRNPIYYDENVAKNSVHKGLIAPPTFPRIFDYGKIEDLNLPTSGLIHGEQSFSYKRPLYVGDELICYTILEDVYEKNGKNGVLTFLVTSKNGDTLARESVFTSRQVTVITEKVKERMSELAN
jgi:acyl dehydratase